MARHAFHPFAVLTTITALATAFVAQAQDPLEDNVVVAEPVKLVIDYVSIAMADEKLKEDDADGALALLEEALERSPDDGTLRSAHGVLLIDRGDLDGAKAEFLTAIERNTDDPSGYAGLCYLAAARGAHGLATDHCMAARARNIDDPVYRKVTVAAELLANPDSGATTAASTLEALVAAYPYVVTLRLLSLQANLIDDRMTAALPDVKMLRQMFPPGAPPRIIDRLAAFRVADIVGTDIPCLLSWSTLRIREHAGEAVAVPDLERLLACRPDDASITTRLVEHYNGEGMAARIQGEYAAAAEHFRAGLELAPEDPVLLNNLAYATFEGKDLEGAEEALRRLLALTPDDPEIRRNYGVVLMMLGREDEARPYIDEAQP
jgi:Flp pilus assembly protein TadD